MLLGALAVSAAAQAPSWPAKPIRVVVPVPPAGAVDIVARIAASGLSGPLGQPVIVESRAGARGVLGTELVAKAAPDGYTLLVTSNAFMVMPFVERKLPFDVLTSFAPVSLLATQPLVLAVHPAIAVHSVNEFVTLAKSRPVGISFATGALGHYLAAEYFRRLAGFDMTHVPYKGGPAAVNDLVGGQVPVALTGQSPMISYARSGRIRAIAVTSKQRSTALPEVPTLAESGIPNIDLFESILMMAPAGTPP
ncbi:MAG: tripartite tricarboxylate transporter substrate-binding protein, partial [Burkholderiales bacterium]